MHGLRHPLLPHGRAGRGHGDGLPDPQRHPRVERPGLPRPVAGGDHPPPQDQQLPRVHRPRLPGALRRLLHARPERRTRDHQDHRVGDHRPGLPRRLGRARAAPLTNRLQGRGGRLRTGRPRRRGAAQQGRPQRDGLRARRPGRRAADVRNPEHEARQGGRRAAGEAARGRGRLLRDRHLGRTRRGPGQARRGLRRRRARGRLDDPSRSQAARPGTRRRLLRDGLPDGEYSSRAWRPGDADLGRRQERHRHRWRRHRHRLRGNRRSARAQRT